MTRLQSKLLMPAVAVFLGAVTLAGCSGEPTPKIADADDLTESVDTSVENDISAGEEINVVDEVDAVDEINVSEQGIPGSTPESELPPPDAGMALAAIENTALLFIAEQEGPTGLNVSASARFHTTATPLMNAPVLSAMTMLDSCEVGSEASQINAEALDVPIDHILEGVGSDILQVTSISAGSTVELSSDAGSFVSLLQNTMPDGIEYLVQEGTDLNMLIPDVLDMVVSGDVFPPLASSWTTPARLDTSLRDDVRAIGGSPTLTWTGSGATDTSQSRVIIYAAFLNELTGELTSFQCDLADDGDFTLPADVQALFEGGLIPNFVDVARYSQSVQLVGDVSVVNVFVQKF